MDEAPKAPNRTEDGRRIIVIKPEWKSLLRWGGDRPLWTAFCPECDFPEADGDYCPACGWTTAVQISNR